MKELDLTNAKFLKLLLEYGGGHDDWDIKHITDICSLTRKVIWSILRTILITLGVFGVVSLSCILLSPLTLFLPQEYYAPLDMITAAATVLGVTTLFCVLFGIVYTLSGDMKMFPDYMIPKNLKNKEEKKEPSKTVLAFKEMHKAFKEKTCFKVKL